MEHTADFLKNVYRDLLSIRLFEEKQVEVYALGKVPGHIHSGIGEEAVAAGVVATRKQGDYFKVTITGYRDGNETSSVEYCLADHRGSADSPDSLTTEWKTLNLMRLGNVQYIDFDIDAQFSNNTEGEDLNYFCMDNLFASIYISQ